MEAKTGTDRYSRNVVAELPGSEFPEEIVVLGGHIDSWDVGQLMMMPGGVWRRGMQLNSSKN